MIQKPMRPQLTLAQIESNKPRLRFRYKNWKGEISVRTVVPMMIWYGSTEWHKEKQYMMYAFDVDKQEYRDFAMNDILEMIKITDEHQSSEVEGNSNE